MEYLEKVKRADLECLFSDLISEVKDKNPELASKYLDELEDYMYSISIEEAQSIVKCMKPIGEKYTYDFVDSALSDRDLEEADIIDYYLTMNMFYNDYKMVFEKYNMNNKDIILDFTEAFINDEDGPKYKTEKYFLLLK